MSSLFDGINIVRNTLSAQTQVLNITAHNVSNANTEGYSKQTVQLAAINTDSRSLRYSQGLSIGSGVEVTTVSRSRSALYDEMYRSANQELSSHAETESLLSQVELMFDEPSDSGLSSLLDNFFTEWQDLANDPQSMASRESLKSAATQLTDRLHTLNSKLIVMSQDADTEIAAIPEAINEITAEIADLNASIRVAEIGGTANDLRDKRDILVDELSQYADTRVVEQDDGTYTVLIGSTVVVEQDTNTGIRSISTASNKLGSVRTVILTEDGTEITPSSGKLGALIEFRDETVGDIQSKLDQIAAALVESVNSAHRDGYGLDGGRGYNFFDPGKTKAFNISLSGDIDDVEHIAASGTGDTGDSGNALAISDVQDQKTVNGEYTISEYYNWLIADIGIKSSEAQSGLSNATLLTEQADNARESVKGVSVDEELIQMIQTQQIYQSASRVLVTINSMLETLINM